MPRARSTHPPLSPQLFCAECSNRRALGARSCVACYKLYYENARRGIEPGADSGSAAPSMDYSLDTAGGGAPPTPPYAPGVGDAARTGHAQGGLLEAPGAAAAAGRGSGVGGRGGAGEESDGGSSDGSSEGEGADATALDDAAASAVGGSASGKLAYATGHGGPFPVLNAPRVRALLPPTARLAHRLRPVVCWYVRA
jgi:hypothetical protein